VSARPTWMDAEVVLLLRAETVADLDRAGEPAVTEGGDHERSGARRLVAELWRFRSAFVCSEGAHRPTFLRALNALLRDFAPDERANERANTGLRRQLEGLGRRGG
jgi:hypothetical protein